MVKMLQKAFGKCSMYEREVYKWYKLFQDFCESVEDYVRVGDQAYQ